MSNDNIWKFGTETSRYFYNDTDKTYDVVDVSMLTDTEATDEMKARAAIVRADVNKAKDFIPVEMIKKLQTTGDTLQYQVGHEKMNLTDKEAEDQIKQWVHGEKNADGSWKVEPRYVLGADGKIIDKDATLETKRNILSTAPENKHYKDYYKLIPEGETDVTKVEVEVISTKVGFQLLTELIDKLQEDIRIINKVVEDLNKLNGWVSNKGIGNRDKNSDAEWHVNPKKADTKVVNNGHGGDGTEGGYREYFMKSLGWGENKTTTFLREVNDRYVEWTDKKNTNAPVINNNRHEFGAGKAHAKFDIEDKWMMGIFDFTFDIALDSLKNTIKEKTTLSEQMGTDFNATNSRFNAVTEEMSTYIKSHFDAIKRFVV